MNKKTLGDTLIIGFAIFATFFGAGNLIFPTSLGFAVGNGWNIAIIGFLLSGIILPMLSIISVGKNGGSIENIAGKVSPIFSKIFTISIMVFVLGLIGLPRIGAVTYELGMLPLFPKVNPIIVSTIFYGITIWFAINPTNVVDKIGKFLTPVLLIILAIILFTGIALPLGTPVDTGIENIFTVGFLTGYEIGDALAGIVIASIFVSAIVSKGYSDSKELSKMSIKCGVVGGLGLFLVYGGLLYLGATGSSLFPADIEKANLLAGIVQKLLGKSGVMALSTAVIFACLTTSIGMSAAIAQFFSDITNNKLSYQVVVVVTNIVAGIFSITGVATIMKIAMPILLIGYPVAIVLIILGLFSHVIPNRGAYIGAVYFTLVISIFDTLVMYGVNIKPIQSFISFLPLSSKGFSWITPAIVGLIIGMLVFPKLIKNDNQQCT